MMWKSRQNFVGRWSALNAGGEVEGLLEKGGRGL